VNPLVASVESFERLLAAGAELGPRFAEVAAGPLAEWLDDCHHA
jgi:hypothetical protein